MARRRVGVIHAVEIRNFKNILHQRIELDRLTVFVGANGSGKTSVLEAINWVTNIPDVNPDWKPSRFLNSIGYRPAGVPATL